MSAVLDRAGGILPRSPSSFPDSPLSRALQQPLLLGLFLPIQAGGWSASRLPRSTTWTFDYNRALTQRAEEFGFDLVFGLSQWLPKGGYGGVLDGTALDSFISVGALAAVTRRILLISTVHVLYGPWHPLHFAKYTATLDHISGGRSGVNIVTGHRAVEHEAFGWPRIDHDRRYELAAEFVDVVQRLWAAEENLSYEGARWSLREAFVTPKPLFGRPILVNATGSDAGIDFAARHSDIVFITSPAGSEIESALDALPAHVARVKAAARAQGREIRTLINPIIVSRDTTAETAAYHDAIVAHADPEAPAGFGRFDSDAHAWRGRAGRDGPAQRALGGNIQIIGTPDEVARYIARLKEAGIDGIQVSFFDFQPDLEHFGTRILPLLERAGLRFPAPENA
ncbi:LLM class flavin-dependent oxidoreductase [Paracraurococcus lichenis]|uniref:LLM class flavin-dependent oxidoreductase n=1 Tax=Paracraurococcus lichenis TaxID=3064888 RepID=A0ABT9E9L6_9PROT|nr:LLM class flavin-dependent oxidoreductase [Paracraurococcus sp. LOR1-02]MDO9712878.1 LLM class flavin-dependent oxidoreductase [Paracraurococcus sp. LOR1-02]